MIAHSAPTGKKEPPTNHFVCSSLVSVDFGPVTGSLDKNIRFAKSKLLSEEFYPFTAPPVRPSTICEENAK